MLQISPHTADLLQALIQAQAASTQMVSWSVMSQGMVLWSVRKPCGFTTKCCWEPEKLCNTVADAMLQCLYVTSMMKSACNLKKTTTGSYLILKLSLDVIIDRDKFKDILCYYTTIHSIPHRVHTKIIYIIQ